MRVQIRREDFKQAMDVAASVAPARTPRPILADILCVADGAGLRLVATDMEQSITLEVPGVEVEEPGACVLLSEKTRRVLSTATDERLALECRDREVTITGQASEFGFPSEDPGLFPQPPAFDASEYHSIAAADLRRLIRRTIFAVDTIATRFAIAGVRPEPGDGVMAFTATDGRRGARQVVPAERVGDPRAMDVTGSVPAKAWRLLDRHLEDTDPPVHVAFTDRDVRFRTGTAAITTVLVEGRWPNFESALPTSVVSRATVDAKLFRTAVDQAAVALDEVSKGVEFWFGGGRLELRRATGKGRSRVAVPVSFEGPDFAIMIDHRYIIDAVKPLPDGTTLTIELSGIREIPAYDSAVNQKAVLRTDDGWLYAVSPMGRV